MKQHNRMQYNTMPKFVGIYPLLVMVVLWVMIVVFGDGVDESVKGFGGGSGGGDDDDDGDSDGNVDDGDIWSW